MDTEKLKTVPPAQNGGVDTQTIHADPAIFSQYTGREKSGNCTEPSQAGKPADKPC